MNEPVSEPPAGQRPLLHLVLPADVDDPEAPSGGNAYDRRVARELAAAGWTVRELTVAGDWPWPDAAARHALDVALAEVPDDGLVLLDGLVACGVPDVVLPHARRLRLVALVHLPLGDEHGATAQAARALTEAERATVHGVAAVVATSGWAARRLVAVHGLDSGRVHVAEPGVDPAPLSRPAPGGGRLACVGSVTRTKGQDVLVEALAEVTDLDWECALVGPLRRDPGQVAEVREAVTRHGLHDRVRLTGPLPAEGVAEVYAATDLLVLPSRAETYGMVLTEALARGVPVLAASVGGVPETVGDTADGRPGLLVDPDDPDAVAYALRSWLTQPALRDRLRGRARDRRRRLSGWAETSRCVERALGRVPDGVPS